MKKIFYVIILSLVLTFCGCDVKETGKMETETGSKEEIKVEVDAELAAENEEKRELKDDKIITTYAYKNLDGIDISTLQEVVINGKEATLDNREHDKLTGDDHEYKVAFFGEVKNVKINYSSYIYEYGGVEIGSYGSLKDTLLTIKSNKMSPVTGFIVSFEDKRGIGGSFIVNDDYEYNEDPIELKSGFTALEKTPSSYAAYDMSGLINCMGMTIDEFDSSDMMQHAQKRLEPGLYEEYYVYYINNLIKGFNITIETQDNILSSCYIRKDPEIYKNLSDKEKYNLLGIDFDMSVVRATYNLIKPDSLGKIDVWSDTSDDICDTLALYNK
jgi:hypothetical protein